jgi:hypothetical protein
MCKHERQGYHNGNSKKLFGGVCLMNKLHSLIIEFIALLVSALILFNGLIEVLNLKSSMIMVVGLCVIVFLSILYYFWLKNFIDKIVEKKE